MSSNHLPFIAIGPGCTAASELPESIKDDEHAIAPYPALMYTPVDLEGQGGVDVGARGGRSRGRGRARRRASSSRRRRSSSRRRGRRRNVCVGFFRTIWYLIKLLLWDIPCCFIGCGHETVDCFRACRGGDSSDEEDAYYQEQPAAKRSRTVPPPPARYAEREEVVRLRAEIEQLRQDQQ